MTELNPEFKLPFLGTDLGKYVGITDPEITACFTIYLNDEQIARLINENTREYAAKEFFEILTRNAGPNYVLRRMFIYRTRNGDLDAIGLFSLKEHHD